MILSDTHLGPPGRGARSAAALRPLWQGATEVIFNGDIAEVHDPQWRGEAARQVMRIQEYCEVDDVRFTMLAGNHDPLITDRRFLRLCRGEVFLTHGDLLHPAVSPWIKERALMKALHDDALAALDPAMRDVIDARAAALQIAELRKWDWQAAHGDERLPKWRRMLDLAIKTTRVMYYWQTLPRTAAQFAHEHVPDCRFFIFGHIHRAGIWHNRDKIIINTGSYDLPSRPHGVIIEGNTLQVKRIHGSPSGYYFANKPRAVYELNNALVDFIDAQAAA